MTPSLPDLDIGADGGRAYDLLTRAHGLFWMATALAFSGVIYVAPTNHYTVSEACLGGGIIALMGFVASLSVGFPGAVRGTASSVGLRLLLVLVLWFGFYALFGWRTQGPAFLSPAGLSTVFVLMGVLVGGWSSFILLSKGAIRLHTEAIRAERAIADARSQRLARLRSQLAPHFICNALNSIAAKMEQEPKAAQRMAADLADLVRDALHDLGDEGTIEQEMMRLHTYLAVEKSRFEDQLRFDVDVAEEALGAPCPPLLLLPLVENAVRHGSRTTEQPLEVRLAIALGDEGELRVRVENPGSLSRRHESAEKHGVGLENVRRRLKELYPDRHELSLQEARGKVLALLTLRG